MWIFYQLSSPVTWRGKQFHGSLTVLLVSAEMWLHVRDFNSKCASCLCSWINYERAGPEILNLFAPNGTFFNAIFVHASFPPKFSIPWSMLPVRMRALELKHHTRLIPVRSLFVAVWLRSSVQRLGFHVYVYVAAHAHSPSQQSQPIPLRAQRPAASVLS
jgi:hypothetical protein